MIFNGHQNPETLLWGHIAEKLGRSDIMAPFWRNGAKTPGVDEWVAVVGDKPVLILLDELPSYLEMAQGEPVGATTLGDLTIGALERLFNALPRCPRACVVVTNLKDDVYLDGSGQLRTLIENLSKHYDRNAQAITPVQQNTGEVFEIVRKRLFDGLPRPDRIDEVAQAFVGALQKAKRVDTIPSTPETFIERIRETYPFHPSIRDIVARFAENRGYQKTRALIRLLRLAVRGALKTNDNAFLIGLQHLDFNDQGTLEEIRKINPAYTNAISRDVADRGNALAEKIDAADGACKVRPGISFRALTFASSLVRPPTSRLRSPILLRTSPRSRSTRRYAPSCRRCSGRELEVSIPIGWRSCPALTNSSWMTTVLRSSCWSGLPTSSRRTSSTGGTSRTSRTECLC